MSLFVEINKTKKSINEQGERFNDGSELGQEIKQKWLRIDFKMNSSSKFRNNHFKCALVENDLDDLDDDNDDGLISRLRASETREQ